MDMAGAFDSVDLVEREKSASRSMRMRLSPDKKRRRRNVVNIAAAVAFRLGHMRTHNEVRMQTRWWCVVCSRTVKKTTRLK